jgi:hypothetical protein
VSRAFVVGLGYWVAVSGCATPAHIPAQGSESGQELAYQNALYRSCRDMGLPPGTLVHVDCMAALHARNRANLGAEGPSQAGTILQPVSSTRIAE